MNTPYLIPKIRSVLHFASIIAFGSLKFSVSGEEPAFSVANTINGLGIDLLHQSETSSGNFLVSPYSIQSALAMTYAGAAGATQDEMARVLRFPANEAVLHSALARLQQRFTAISVESSNRIARMKNQRWQTPGDPVQFHIVNRLFGQSGYEFRPAFLDLVKNNYQAPLESLDFSKQPAAATQHINAWVEQQTQRRICNLIPGLPDTTRLVLVNAIYLKAPWATEFNAAATQPRSFFLGGGDSINVATMTQQGTFGYAKGKDFTAISLGYSDSELEFLILLPDRPDGLSVLENQISPELLAQQANLSPREVRLFVPKFKLEPAVLPLRKRLQALGLNSAFDIPRGSANFDRIAPRRVDDYLYISEVYHKTFLQIDEKGTEAAAATTVVAITTGIHEAPPEPIEVKVDHPFLFAIQHRSTGVCLFLGRLTDPR